MQTNKPLISKSDFYKEYYLNNKSCEQIAKEYGFSKTTAIRYLHRFGYDRKTPIANLLGKKIGKLLVVKYLGKIKGPKRKNAGHYWECLCECGQHKKYSSSALNNVKSCGCSQYSNKTGIRGRYWNKVKKGAITRNIEFNITQEEAWEIYLQQNKKCYFSGLSIEIQNNVARSGKKIYEFTASLDRLDNTKSYNKNNCVWVHKNINVMKNSFTSEEFISFCKLVARYHKKQKIITLGPIYASDTRRKANNNKQKT